MNDLAEIAAMMPNIRLSIVVAADGSYAGAQASWSPRPGEDYRRGFDLPDGRPSDIRAALHRALDIVLDSGSMTEEQRIEVYALVEGRH